MCSNMMPCLPLRKTGHHILLCLKSCLELAYEFAEDAAHTVGGCIGGTYDFVTIVDEVIIEVPAFVGDD